MSEEKVTLCLILLGDNKMKKSIFALAAFVAIFAIMNANVSAKINHHSSTKTTPVVAQDTTKASNVTKTATEPEKKPSAPAKKSSMKKSSSKKSATASSAAKAHKSGKKAKKESKKPAEPSPNNEQKN